MTNIFHMTNFLWLDLEMTGLDVKKERIIEVAAVVTNERFETQESFHAIVKQPQEFLDGMDEWNQTHHKASGLLDKVPLGEFPEKVEKNLCEMVKRHFTEPAVLAGNSIGQDKRFINEYFKDLSKLLHYRVLDVSSWKLVFQTIYDVQFKKQESHRALDDIHESIDELRFYMSMLDEERIKKFKIEGPGDQ